MAETFTWLDRHVGPPYVGQSVIADAAARRARQSVPETLPWLETVNDALLRAGSDSTAGYRVWLDTWVRKEGPQPVETWLQAHATHRHYDHLAWQYAALLAGKDAQQATRWANTIKSAAIREEALRVIGTRAPRKSAPRS